MADLLDADEFVAGPCSHYWGDFLRTRDLSVLEDTTQFPDELVPVVAGSAGPPAVAADPGIHYMNSTQAPTVITPTGTFRERRVQKDGVVAVKRTPTGITVATSYAGVSLEKLAAAWHAEVQTTGDPLVRRLVPTYDINYKTLVVDGVGVTDQTTGEVLRRRLIVPKVAVTADVSLTYDDENDTLLEVTWTGFKPGNVAGDEWYWFVEGPAFPETP